MRKALHKLTGLPFERPAGRLDDSVENFKRRNALGSFDAVDSGSKLFFERIVNVKKIKELVFVTKANAKSR